MNQSQIATLFNTIQNRDAATAEAAIRALVEPLLAALKELHAAVLDDWSTCAVSKDEEQNRIGGTSFATDELRSFARKRLADAMDAASMLTMQPPPPSRIPDWPPPPEAVPEAEPETQERPEDL
jgi:hypothetical protein